MLAGVARLWAVSLSVTRDSKQILVTDFILFCNTFPPRKIPPPQGLYRLVTVVTYFYEEVSAMRLALDFIRQTTRLVLFPIRTDFVF